MRRKITRERRIFEGWVQLLVRREVEGSVQDQGCISQGIAIERCFISCSVPVVGKANAEGNGEEKMSSSKRIGLSQCKGHHNVGRSCAIMSIDDK